ncbi:mucin TcMUCII [Trypanosoma cruzi Dm28c]|uniref:Mucin TcMUCII n=1 Tax=Trypanosoma cruzi Dm28c TaxID=1416333 RepID=V5A391_TRYCR|nr:mucin TcMUCII [Trypanosoma cruzi Dm28c]
MRLLRWWPGLHGIECDECGRRPTANELLVVNIGCTSRGPTIRMVCGDLFFYCYFAFVLLCALHLLLCVCILREGCRHDGPLSRYVHAVEPCVPLLFASPSFICVLVLRQGCVCVCRGLECVLCVVCGVRCMPGCCPLLMWCALCVCLLHLSSPLLLSISLTVRISSIPLNDHTHDDDDVPSAVRPVGACPVLLLVRLRDRGSASSRHFFPDDHDDNHDKTTNHDHHHHNTGTNDHHHYNTGTKHYDYRGASCVDHPRTVTSSRNRRQPQQLCVGVCPAGARCIRAGVRHCGLKRCVRAVRASN